MTKNISQNTLKIYRQALIEYLEKKEELTRFNLLARERRGAKIGILTALFPPFSLSALMLNYSKSSGLLYKSLHWFTPYSPGKTTVFFPDFKRYMGARFKDLFHWRSNSKSLKIRKANMESAQLLLNNIDAGTSIENIKKLISEQKEQKEQKNERDSYFQLLVKLQRINKTTSVENKPEKELSKPNLNESDAVNDIERRYEKPFSLGDEFNRPIPLPQHIRIFDKIMGMDLSEKNYEQYVIKGVKKGTQHLVGGPENKVLQDGWYQFVIVADKSPDSKAPLIRYYPCAEKRTGVPFSQQTLPSQPAPIRIDGYVIHRPQSFELKYEKFIAHSELSGGQDAFAAGAFRIHKGKLVMIEDSSGHYGEHSMKDKYGQLKIACKLFHYYGAETKTVILEHWEPFHGTSKLLRKGAALIMGVFAPSAIKEAKILPQLVEGRPTAPGKASPIDTLIRLETKFSP